MTVDIGEECTDQGECARGSGGDAAFCAFSRTIEVEQDGEVPPTIVIRGVCVCGPGYHFDESKSSDQCVGRQIINCH